MIRSTFFSMRSRRCGISDNALSQVKKSTLGRLRRRQFDAVLAQPSDQKPEPGFDGIGDDRQFFGFDVVEDGKTECADLRSPCAGRERYEFGPSGFERLGGER